MARMNVPAHPIASSYWVRPGRLLAGEYPGDRYEADARQKLRRLLEAGVTYLLDLTEAGEYDLNSYLPLLREEAETGGHAIVHRRMPIPDMTAPQPEQMMRILDTIDEALGAGHTVYLHCYGGIGRTGTVVGCYLVRRGMSGTEAMDEIVRLRRGTPDGDRPSPQTRAQRALVRSWPARERGTQCVAESRILIVPTRVEGRAVRRALPELRPRPGWEVPAWCAGDLLVVEPGMGPERIVALLPHLDRLLPDVVWLFGWCGGLTNDLQTGDLVLADATVLRNGETVRIAHPPPDQLLAQVRTLAADLGARLTVGPVLTSNRALLSIDEKRAGAQSGALAVEMEAGPLARWAAARGVSFVHLRVVLDPGYSAEKVSEQADRYPRCSWRSVLPSERTHDDGYGRGSMRTYLLRAALRPRQWRAVWRLMRQVPIATRAMTRTIAALARPGGLLSPGG